MSFQKYLTTISQIDTGKIYVENVRSVMKVSTHQARIFCEMAVQDNLFIRKIGLVCPNDDRIIAEYNDEKEIPHEVSCHICRAEGIEPDTFATKQLRKIVFYTLKKRG